MEVHFLYSAELRSKAGEEEFQYKNDECAGAGTVFSREVFGISGFRINKTCHKNVAI